MGARTSAADSLRPPDPKQVPDSKKRVRADKHAPGPEETAIRQAPDDAKVLGSGRRTAKPERRLRHRREGLAPADTLETFNQSAHPFVIGPDIGHAHFLAEIPVGKIPVLLPLARQLAESSRAARLHPSTAQTSKKPGLGVMMERLSDCKSFHTCLIGGFLQIFIERCQRQPLPHRKFQIRSIVG